MFPPFPTQKAQKICLLVLEKIKSGEIGVEQVTEESEERAESGFMIGAMVCADDAGNERVFVTNSGISRTLVIPPNLKIEGLNVEIAPPIVSAKKISLALKKNDTEIHDLTKKIQENRPSPAEKNAIAQKRKKLCAESLSRVHALYSFHCADGAVRSLLDICALTNGGRLPPTGTGDCCAPKLLDYAFANSLTPVSMAESFFPTGEFHEPCDERCGILLPVMLGLKILYRDDDICVVDKQSGLLSVPGRGEAKRDSVETRLRRLFPACISQPAVHRLDMETSGILVLAFTKDAHRALNQQFERGEIQKEYVALLDGVLAKKGIASHGTMELFFRLDVENRPHQIWDAEHGKHAITEWEILGVERYRAPSGSVRAVTRVRFVPHTGRTHQLRTASADAHGFCTPIIGDTLYGHCDEGERLCLHARKIAFTHPRTGERMEFVCEAGF